MTSLSINVMYIWFGIFIKGVDLNPSKQLLKKVNIYSFYFWKQYIKHECRLPKKL